MSARITRAGQAPRYYPPLYEGIANRTEQVARLLVVAAHPEPLS